MLQTTPPAAMNVQTTQAGSTQSSRRGSQSTQPANEVAKGGMFVYTPQSEFELVRVLVNAEAGVYPEISAGRHRFTVRFMAQRDVNTRAFGRNQEADLVDALRANGAALLSLGMLTWTMGCCDT